MTPKTFRISLDGGGALVLDEDGIARLIDQLRVDGHLANREGTAPAVGAPASAPTDRLRRGASGRLVLDADHPMWLRHSGGQRSHSGPNWEPGAVLPPYERKSTALP